MPIWALVLISAAGFLVLAGITASVFVFSFFRAFFTSALGTVKKIVDGTMDVN